jgi:hypothetical protein
MNWLFLFGIYLPIAIFYRASHKLTESVKAEEVFWETRNKGFLNIAVLTLRMLL